LISQEKIITTGLITKAIWFEDDVEISDYKSTHVTGYEYNYTFSSNNGEIVSGVNFTYGELPFNKLISEIPYEINIEYLKDQPKIN